MGYDLWNTIYDIPFSVYGLTYVHVEYQTLHKHFKYQKHSTNGTWIARNEIHSQLGVP